MIIYLDRKFDVVEKESARMAKVIPGNGEPPYFIRVYKYPNQNREELQSEKNNIGPRRV